MNEKGSHMNVTGLLVTGYNGDKPIYAVNLHPGGATTILTGHDDGETTTVDAAKKQTTQAFGQIRDLLEELVSSPGS